MPFIVHEGHRYLYIHVPKTGGGTIESWMGSISPLKLISVGIPSFMKATPQHMCMSDVREIFGNDYFKHVFMTVRNPYDRLMSEYRMHAIQSTQGFWKAGPTFSQWLEQNLEMAKKNPFHRDNHMRPQWNFFDSGVEVMRFEEGLPTIVARMATIIGVDVPQSLPHVHETASGGIESTYSAIDRLRVQDFYARDFTLFGYNPEIY